MLYLAASILMDLVRLSGEKKLEIKKLTGGKSSPRNSVIAHHVQKYFFTHPYTGVLVYRIPFSIFQIHSEGKKLYAQMRPKALLSIEKVKAYIRRENILKCPGEVFVRAFLSNLLPTFFNSTDFILLSDTTTSLFLNLAVLVNYFCFHCFATLEQNAVCLVPLDIVSRLGHISERVYVSKATIFIIFFFPFV